MSDQLTAWLDRLREGDREALERVLPLVYDELRGAARRQLRAEGRDHTLTPTALVHETYLRLLQQRSIDAGHRADFLGIAARTMRRVLVDHARRRLAAKRGGGGASLPIDELEIPLSEGEAEEMLALEAALERLALLDARASRVVEYRFFGGLSVEESAHLLGVSTKTVQRTWLAARAWLRKEVAHDLGLPD
jgi:RNA polymerase sigma factor (TIGR02999 family)